MEVGELFHPRTRIEWRAWLEEHHATQEEIWVRLYKKASGVPSLAYNDLVEECLCFGWIDSIIKPVDDESRAQRITPRRSKSFLSELNRQRVWKLAHLGLMTEAGWSALGEQVGEAGEPEMPDWVVDRLREDAGVWETFQEFPLMYRRLKVAWMTEVRGSRDDERERRISHLVKQTAAGKRYGTEPLRGILYEVE